LANHEQHSLDILYCQKVAKGIVAHPGKAKAKLFYGSVDMGNIAFHIDISSKKIIFFSKKV